MREKHRIGQGADVRVRESDGLSVAAVPPPRRRGKRERGLFDGENGAN